MAITKIKKEEIVKEINNEVDKAKVIIFTDFKGTDMPSINELRKNIRETGGRYVVVKKTLLRKVLEDKKIQGINPIEMEGQIAVAFGMEDPVATAKAVNEMRKINKKPKILSGIMDGRILSEAEIIELASLPSKKELLAIVVGGINAPVSGFVNVLAGNLKSLVYALSAIKEQKS